MRDALFLRCKKELPFIYGNPMSVKRAVFNGAYIQTLLIGS